MPALPSSLTGLLSLLAPSFSVSCSDTFCWLLYGFVAASASTRSRAHDFFAYRLWEPDDLGQRLLDLLVTVFVSREAPLRLAIDDTLTQQTVADLTGVNRAVVIQLDPMERRLFGV
jgi:hypothetical protein